jgi:hypothetical protein
MQEIDINAMILIYLQGCMNNRAQRLGLAAAREMTSRNCAAVNWLIFSKPIYGGTGIKASQILHLRPGLQQAHVVRRSRFTKDPLSIPAIQLLHIYSQE